MLNNKNVLRGISLVIAVFLWMYVMGEVNPETKDRISNIEINFVNTEVLADRGLAVVYDNDMKISAIIKGSRSNVNETKESGLVATVDVSACTEGTNTGNVELSLPDGISLDSISDDTVKFEVEEIAEEEKPVEIEFIGEDTSDSEYEPWAYDIEPETVTVTGAKSSVNKVDAVKGTVTRNVAGARARNVDVDLVPVTKDGMEIRGLTLDRSAASMQVQLMKTKDVNISITAQNLESGFEIDTVSGADSVRVIGVAGVIDDLQEIEAYVDLSGVTSEAKREISIQLPDNVYLYNEDKVPEVTVTVKEAD